MEDGMLRCLTCRRELKDEARNSATSATGATARSRVRAHLRHLEELRREDDAGAHVSRHADSSGRAAEPSASHVVSPFRFGNIVDPFEKEFAVVRELRCADLMSGCDFVAQGKDDSEVMKKTADTPRAFTR